MSFHRLWPAIAVLTTGAASQAAESVNGRWARNEAHCSASTSDALIITDTTLRWRGDACRVGRQYRTGNTLHLEAFCRSDNGERAVPVSFRLAGNHIVVTWARVVEGELQRCP